MDSVIASGTALTDISSPDTSNADQASSEHVSGTEVPPITAISSRKGSTMPIPRSSPTDNEEQLAFSYIVTYEDKIDAGVVKAVKEKFKLSKEDKRQLILEAEKNGKFPKLILFEKRYPHISNRHWQFQDSNVYVAPYTQTDIIRIGTFNMIYNPSVQFSLNGRGIRLGDVGYVDRRGLFHVVDNIFDGVETDQTRGFIPVDIASDYIVSTGLGDFNCWHSQNLQRRSPREYVAPKPIKQAHILMAEDAYECRLSEEFFLDDVVIAFFRLFTHHLYEHAKNVSKTKIRNGSLFLIQECIMASLWRHGSLVAPSNVAGITITVENSILRCPSAHFHERHGETSSSVADHALAVGVRTMRLVDHSWDEVFAQEPMKDDPSSDSNESMWWQPGWTSTIKKASVASRSMLKGSVQKLMKGPPPTQSLSAPNLTNSKYILATTK